MVPLLASGVDIGKEEGPSPSFMSAATALSTSPPPEVGCYASALNRYQVSNLSTWTGWIIERREREAEWFQDGSNASEHITTHADGRSGMLLGRTDTRELR